jgi:hypothetical protein
VRHWNEASSHVTIVSDGDLGSPFHMVMSSYTGTPQPWITSVKTHYRVIRVAGRLMLVHCDGPAPGGRWQPPPEPLASTRETGWLMSMPPDVDRFLAALVSSGRAPSLDRPFVPVVLDRTASAFPVYLGLLVWMAMQVPLGRGLLRHWRRAGAPLTDPEVRLFVRWGNPGEIARALDADVSGDDALQLDGATRAGRGFVLQPGRLAFEVIATTELAKVSVSAGADRSIARVRFTTIHDEVLTATCDPDTALALVERARKEWKCRVMVEGGLKDDAESEDAPPRTPARQRYPGQLVPLHTVPSASEQVTVLNPESATCLYCGTALLPRPLVVCPRCQAPHHADCWNDNGGRCTTYGCVPGGRGSTSTP